MVYDSIVLLGDVVLVPELASEPASGLQSKLEAPSKMASDLPMPAMSPWPEPPFEWKTLLEMVPELVTESPSELTTPSGLLSEMASNVAELASESGSEP